MTTPPPRSTPFPTRRSSDLNAELMIDPKTGQPHTAHTTNPVPFHLIDEDSIGAKLRAGGALEDVAPTMLRSEEHTSELQSHSDLVCRLLLEKKKKKKKQVED